MKPFYVHQPVILESIRDMYSAQHSAIYLTQRLLWSQIYNTQAHRTWALLGARLCALAGPVGQHVLRAPRWPGAAPACVGNVLSGRQPPLLCGSPRHSRRASSSRRPSAPWDLKRPREFTRPAPGLTRPLTSQHGWLGPLSRAQRQFPLSRAQRQWMGTTQAPCMRLQAVDFGTVHGRCAGPPPPFLLHARVRCKRALCVNSKCGALF